MKKPFDVLDYRIAAIAVSSLFILAGLAVFIVLGFNTGIDFGSGYSERISIAPVGFTVSYAGDENAVLSVENSMLVLTKRGSGGVTRTVFDPSLYRTTDDIVDALCDEGADAELVRSEDSRNLITGFGYPITLSDEKSHVNYATDTVDVSIEDIREALADIDSVNVQTVGRESDAIYQIRIPVDEESTRGDAERVVSNALSDAFGSENIVIMQSDYVGPKFSSSLFRDSILALLIALVLILGYVALRFRLSYSLSAIIALFHDVLSMLSFVLIFRLEVSSTTIAAVLTIIGYSINNTIVIFDRVRENIKDAKGAVGDVDGLIALSVRQSVTRSVMTSLTTLVAIVPLAVFSSGDIKLFAINLTWGIIIGAYSSNFLAPAFLHYFHRIMPIDKMKEKKEEEEYSLV